MTRRTAREVGNRSTATVFHDGAPPGHLRPSSLRGSAYAQTVVDPGPGAHGCRPRVGAGARAAAPATDPAAARGGGGGAGVLPTGRHPLRGAQAPDSPE